jgi:hypothetical protein
LRLFQLVPRWAAVLVPLALVACAARTSAADPASARPGGCETRVIVAFAAEMQHAPDDRFVADLGRAADVQLTFVSVLARNLYLFTLSGSSGDVDCRPALERLRQDARVRSVEVDERRQHH